MTEAKKPTSLEAIKKIKREDLEELPAFLDGTPFVAKLRRPSLIHMVDLEQIPNELSVAVDELMGGQAAQYRTSIKERSAVLCAVAKAALVQPTYEEVEDVIDSFQLTAIWNYVISGVNALVPFREVRAVFVSSADKRAVDAAAELDTGADATAA